MVAPGVWLEPALPASGQVLWKHHQTESWGWGWRGLRKHWTWKGGKKKEGTWGYPETDHSSILAQYPAGTTMQEVVPAPPLKSRQREERSFKLVGDPSSDCCQEPRRGRWTSSGESSPHYATFLWNSTSIQPQNDDSHCNPLLSSIPISISSPQNETKTKTKTKEH